MSEDQEKILKAMRVMAEPKEKILSPVETIQRHLDKMKDDGWNVKAIALGQSAFVAFSRELNKMRIKRIDLVDADGNSYKDDEVMDVEEWNGIKVYKKSTPGFEPLF